MKDDVLIGDTPKARRRRKRLEDVQTRGRLWKHSRLADIEGLVSVEEMHALFVVTLVRNPWDRLVSYYHWLKEQSFGHPAVGLARDLPFDAFVTHPLTFETFRQAPYTSYVTDPAGHDCCDSFIRLEHFEQDAAAFEAHLGFRLRLPAGVNASRRERDYRCYYSETLAGRVAEMCRDDIARFGYRF